MKKHKLKTLALLGLAASLCGASDELSAKDYNKSISQTSTSSSKQAASSNSSSKDDAERDKYMSQNSGYHVLTEDELVGQLNATGLKLYMSLDDEGKALARKVASQLCNGTNDCKGLNSCKTDQNNCAGQGSCRGKTKCAIGDKNLAVKLAAKHMAEKRGQTFDPTINTSSGK